MGRMITDFLTRKTNLNILQFIVAFILSYCLLTRYSTGETLLLMVLVVILNIIVHIKAIAKGMLIIKTDPVMNSFLKEIEKIEETDKKKKG